MSEMGILQHSRTVAITNGTGDRRNACISSRCLRLNDVADSVILAGFNLILLVALGLVLLTTSYAILFIAVFWCALPISLLLTFGFWIRDIRKGLRKQAKIAALLLLPLVAYEVWLLGFNRLDF
jgi:hypothetical protein